MRTPSRTAILTALLLLASIGAQAQQKASIQGRVSTIENGVSIPVDYAVILLKPAGVYTTTDEQGSYRLGGLDPGSYQINIQLIGYETIDTTLTIRGEV
ncbi:MAG: carboxypeptidase-like regulatory domain-containing protein, partial [Bacteroidales bacterium]|nr:carboxypeptidase-like regulatory domain-containing protein [Bacteroidales bacterium]